MDKLAFTYKGRYLAKIERKHGTDDCNFKKVTDHLCYLFLIFLTGCLVGWVYEEVFYWITEGLLRNRGILHGP